MQKFSKLKINVYAVKNEFFGGGVNVSGLVVGGDIITSENVNSHWEEKTYSDWSNYLLYSSAATNGLYYEK